MGITRVLKKLKGMPGVLKARHLAEVTVTPHLRGQLAELRAQSTHTAALLEQVRRQTADLETYQPLVLNAISSTNGVARQLRREFTTVADRTGRLEAWIVEHSDDSSKLIELWRGDLAPHVASLGWLLQRVEMVRAEMLNELRYTSRAAAAPIDAVEARVVTEGILDGPDVRLNLGSGQVPVAGFVNVDMRELPGVDVVATLDDLPVDTDTVAEIFSSHVLEHFPREQLARTLIPYWFSKLRPGGTFRAIVPDLAAMSAGFAAGSIPFDVFREVVYGGQEYEGDTHFTGFTPAAMTELLTDSGFEHVEVVAEGRKNGMCLEFEITAVKPSE